MSAAVSIRSGKLPTRYDRARDSSSSETRSRRSPLALQASPDELDGAVGLERVAGRVLAREERRGQVRDPPWRVEDRSGLDRGAHDDDRDARALADEGDEAVRQDEPRPGGQCRNRRCRRSLGMGRRHQRRGDGAQNDAPHDAEAHGGIIPAGRSADFASVVHLP
jgi:hypothetical protein